MYELIAIQTNRLKCGLNQRIKNQGKRQLILSILCSRGLVNIIPVRNGLVFLTLKWPTGFFFERGRGKRINFVELGERFLVRGRGRDIER